MARNLVQQMTADQFRQQVSSPGKPVRAKVRARHETGTKNGTEKRFESEYLQPLVQAGQIAKYDFEAQKFRVGTDTSWLVVDYTIVWADGSIEQVDVKGGTFEEDALAKVKAAALQFPEYHWSWWSYKGKRKGWELRRFGDAGDHPFGDYFPLLGTF